MAYDKNIHSQNGRRGYPVDDRPAGLSELESALGDTSLDPPPSLRQAVMRTVETELVRPSQADAQPSGNPWRFAAALAAGFLLLANAGMSGFVFPSEYDAAVDLHPERLGLVADALRELDLELTESEIRWQSLRLVVGGRNLIHYGSPRGSSISQF